MSLVDYQSSDESDVDADDDKSSADIKNISNPSLSFVIPRKAKESVKITVPSLKEFEDEEDSELRCKKTKRLGNSTLIGMLPPPKYARNSPGSFLPYALSKKRNTTSDVSKIPVPKTPFQTTVRTDIKALSDSEDGCSKNRNGSEEEKGNQSPIRNFFSLEEPTESTEQLNVSHSFSNNDKIFVIEPASSNIAGGEVDMNQNSGEFQSVPENYTYSSVHDDYSGYNLVNEASEPTTSSDQYLTDEGFLRLQGKRRARENINIIDVCADDQLTDNTKWLTKSLTEEKTHRPSMKKDQMPTQQQRRKHQITYLAFQAKEREQELKNQWSHNRLTKRETQAKYGF